MLQRVNRQRVAHQLAACKDYTTFSTNLLQTRDICIIIGPFTIANLHSRN